MFSNRHLATFMHRTVHSKRIVPIHTYAPNPISTAFHHYTITCCFGHKTKYVEKKSERLQDKDMSHTQKNEKKQNKLVTSELI